MLRYNASNLFLKQSKIQNKIAFDGSISVKKTVSIAMSKKADL